MCNAHTRTKILRKRVYIKRNYTESQMVSAHWLPGNSEIISPKDQISQDHHQNLGNPHFLMVEIQPSQPGHWPGLSGSFLYCTGLYLSLVLTIHVASSKP
jgi:hypothetical protein